MSKIDELKEFGVNTEEGLGRCFGNEDFYLRLVRMIPNDANFEALKEKVAAGDLTGGFEAAHALKGAVGNLSITPIFEPVSELTEMLRARTGDDYTKLVNEVLRQRDILKEILERGE